MKKRKILYLFPLAALVLSGCTFQEGWEITKNWTNEKVFTPVVEFFKDIFGIEDKKEEKKDDEKPAPSPSGEDQGGEDEGGGGGGQQGYVDPRDEYGTLHEGTQEDPLTGEDASLVASLLSESGSQDKFPTKESYYIKGVVQRLNEDFTPSYGNYSPVIENEFVGYRLKFGPNKANFNEGDVAVGDTVTMYAQIINFHGTYETNGGYIANVEKPAIDAELVEIKLSGTPKSEYIVGNQYNHEGLVVTAVYDNGQEQNVTSAAEWTYSKEVAEIGDTSVTITATYQGFSQSITVNVTVIEALNYGSLENPLTIEEAIAVIDKESPTSQTVYVTGEVKSNKAYSTKYNNTEIWITDGEHDFELYGCSLPEGFTPAQPVENDPALVGKVVVAHGTAKKYNTTYELDKGCAIDTVSEPAPIVVEQVVLTDESLSLEVGQQAALGASVLPEKASQEVTWTIDNGNSPVEIVSFENGMVHALAEGEAIITATSVADPTVSASCAVTVTEATKTLESIAITGTPDKLAYYHGEAFDPTGLKVMAHYDKGEDEDVTANATIVANKETAEYGDTSVSFGASYGGKSATETFQITVEYKKGSEQLPYTGAEATDIANGLESGGVTTESFYIQGVVQKFKENFNPSYGNYSFEIDGGFVGWRLKDGENGAKFTEGALELGDTVLMYCQIQNYNGTPESKGGYIKTITKATVQSVSISGEPTQTEYGVGTSYNHNGLVAKALMDTGVERDVTEAAEWAFSKATAELGDTSFTVTAAYGGKTSEAFTVNVTVSSGTVLVETEVYKLNGNETGGTNGYATDSEIAQGGINWLVTGNTTQAPWRIGGKNLTNVDRNVKSVDKVSADDLTKVTVTTGTANLSAVNSITINVGSTAGGNDLGTKAFTSNLTSTTLEFARPEGKTWSNAYITVVFNVSAGGSNSYIQLVAVQLYAMK